MTPQVEATGVTTFANEACEQVEVLGKHHVPIGRVIDQSELQDLKEYYRRPKLIATGTLPNATTRSLLFEDASLFSYYDLDRLNGVTHIRFDLVFTLQVANTPFHQGVLAMAWNYGVGETTLTNDPEVTFIRSAYPYSCTNVPHVRLNLAEATMAQLKIPFLHESDCFDIRASFYYGNLGLNILLPVEYVSGVSTPSYKMFMHLENLELIGAIPFNTDIVTIQSGRQLPFNKEQEEQAFPISSGMKAGSKALRLLARGIPAISSVASSVGWALGNVAGFARSFGYSKPQIQDPIIRQFPQQSILEHNVDTPAATITVGPLASNTLVPNNIAGTDVDEMAMEFVTTQFSQVCRGSFLSTHTTGTRLYMAPVTPSALWYREPTTAPFCNIPAPTHSTGKNAFMPSSLFWISSCFRQWRGDIEYRFTFGKTKMHGGRLLVTFVPHFVKSNIGDTAKIGWVPFNEPEGPDTTGYSAIWDLRDASVFTFKCPYISQFPNVQFEDSIGTLSVTVLDPLAYSPTVSTRISFLVEARGCPGFEPSVPVGPLYFPWDAGYAITLQAGKLVSCYDETVNQQTIGEKIMSLKQLVMIPKVAQSTVASGAHSMNIPPWWYNPSPSKDTEAVKTAAVSAVTMKQAYTWGGYLSSAYLFVRGSTEFHAYPHDVTQAMILNVAFDRSGYADSIATPSPRYDRTGTCLPRAFTTGPMHARFPAYAGLPRIRPWTTRFILAAGSLTVKNWNPDTANRVGVLYPNRANVNVPTIHFWNNNVSEVRYRFSRAAGDDAQMGHYVGPPPLYILPNAPSGSGRWDPDNVNIV